MATRKQDIFNNIDKFNDIFESIYGESNDFYKERLEKIIDAHVKKHGDIPFEVYSSPGRIEVVGNHTDHNGGKVVAAAITVDTLSVVSERDDNIIEINSCGYSPIIVDTNDLEIHEKEYCTSRGIVRGVCKYFVDHGKKIGGFNATTVSNVPKGAGVSSSSSFELFIAEVLNVKYNDGKLDAIFKAKASQFAENKYFGKPCGLMDQSAIALGGVNLIDFRDFENPIVKNAKWNFKDIDIFVIATGGDHCDLTDDYAAIVGEMKAVCKNFDKELLIEVDSEDFYKNEASLKGKVSDRALLRAEHFFEENQRVINTLESINNNDEKGFLKQVNESGESSRYKLQNLVSAKTQDKTLENALDAVADIDGVVAKRVHGGGFAGTILVLTEKAKRDNVQNKFNEIFGAQNVFRLHVRESGAIRIY